VLAEPRYFEHARSILMDHIATNWYTNDGAYYEGSIPGYGQFGLQALREASRWLRRFDPGLVSGRVVKGYLFGPSMVCLGRTLPNNDDSGAVEMEKLSGRPKLDTGEYERAYLDYKDDRLLEAVLGQRGEGRPSFSSLEDLLERRSEADAATLQKAWLALRKGRPKSVVTRAGYAVLRGGRDDAPFDLFVTFDGQAGSHTHYDTFNPILYGLDYVLVPDLGYPPELRGPSRQDWIGHPLSHWTVTVNRRSMSPDFERGRLKVLADRPGFRAFSAIAPMSYDGVAQRYERILLLIDKPDGTPLVLDFFRVTGGKEHLYSFHGAAADGAEGVSVIGGDLETDSRHETLQGLWHGENVPYARPIEGSEDRCLAYLVDPRTVRPDAEVASLRARFPRGDADGTVLDLWMPKQCAEETIVAEGRREAVSGKGSARLPYLVARSGRLENEQEADSFFCAVVEAHHGEGAVTEVHLDGGDGSLSVRFRDGRSWLVRADLESVVLTVVGKGGAIRRGLSARLETVGRVSGVDYDAREFKVDQPISFGEGEVLLFENDLGRNTFYPVNRVEHGRISIGDRWTDLCVARGHLTGHSGAGRLTYDPDYKIQDPVRAQCRGARVTSESGVIARVERVEPESILLDANTEADVERQLRADAESGSPFKVFDFGVGDVIRRVEITDTQGD
jgi:hypothetical protein